MYTFVNLFRRGESWGWYVKVSSVEDLFNWYDGWNGSNIIGKAVYDFMNSKEIEYMKVQPETFKSHACTPYTGMLIAECNRLAVEKGQVSMMDLNSFLVDKIFKVKLDIVGKGQTIYINKSGGFMPSLAPDYTINETITSNEFVFPAYTEQDIKITRWPNGVHYYARIAHMDVRVDGEMKWRTYELALEKAMLFLNKLRQKT